MDSRQSIPSAPQILDLPSESIFAWEHEGYPQTDYAGFLFQGRCDPEALNRALIGAQAMRPNFHANLCRVRRGPFSVLAWVPRDEPVGLEVRDFTDLEKLPEDTESWLHERMAGEIDHLQDLTQEYPVRHILYLLPDRHGILVFYFHHVATDGGGVYDFLKEAFRIYHKSVTGADPLWAEVAGLHAQAGAVRTITAPSGWKFFRESMAEWRVYPIHKVVQIASSPDPRPGRNIVRTIIKDKKLQAAMRDRARREGGTLSDLLLASSKLALEQWNLEHGAPAQTMNHGLAVNQRLRRALTETEGQGNPMSAISIPSNPQERRDPVELLRYVVQTRKRKLAEGHDLALAAFVRKVLTVGRLLPFAVRYRWLRLILDRPISFFVTNLGVVWPVIENGRPTGETAVRQVGEMNLLDIHACVGSTETNPVGLIARTFLSRLYLVLVVGRHKINDQDAADFSRLLMRKITDYL